MNRRKWLGLIGAAALIGSGVFFLWPGAEKQQQAPASAASTTTRSSLDAPSPASDLDDADAQSHHTVFVDVVGPTHAPLAAAKVVLVGLSGSKEQLTDADGLASFERVSRRVFRVELSARGYITKKVTPPPLTAQTPEVSWSFSLDRDPSVSDEDAQVLTGAVMSDGQPVVGATIFAVREDNKLVGPSDIQRSDATGRFVIPHDYGDVEVPPVVKVVALHRAHGEGEAKVGEGEVTINLPPGGYIEGRVVASDGTLPDRVQLRSVPLFAREHPLVRNLDKEVRRLLAKDRKDRRANELKLTLDHLRRGKLKSLETSLAPDATASASAPTVETTTSAPSQAAEPGVFRIGPVAAHKTVVIASARNFEPDSADVDVPSGETVKNVVLSLSAPLVVTGTVTDADTGKPLKGARIFANTRKAREGAFGRARTNKDGEYTLQTHAGERQTLSAAKRGYRPFDHGGLIGEHGDTLVRNFELRRIQKGKGKGHNRDYVGIGAQLKKTDEGVLIQKIFAGGAAAEALKTGDVIVQVDGEWVEDIPLGVAVESILGEDGTEVELVVRRKGKKRGETEQVTLERRRIQAGGG